MAQMLACTIWENRKGNGGLTGEKFGGQAYLTRVMRLNMATLSSM